MDQQTTKVHTLLSVEDHEQLKALAARNDRSVTAQLRVIIRERLAGEADEPAEAAA